MVRVHLLLLAKAVANAGQCRFINVEARHVMTGELGESEKKVRDIFTQAKRCSPCIVFFDEFQALFGSRAEGGQVTNILIIKKKGNSLRL